MDVELQVNNSAAANARFLTWAPSPCRIRVTNPSGATATDRQRHASPAYRRPAAARVVFRSGTTGAFASSSDGDRSRSTAPPFRSSPPAGSGGPASTMATSGSKPAWARRWSVAAGDGAHPQERQHPDGGRTRPFRGGVRPAQQPGRWAVLRTSATCTPTSAHRRPTARPGFLPWHRAYLLDLERELQAIDPSVALPYWRFDQPAPNLFTARIPRRLRFAGHRPVQQRQPAAVLEDRRRAGHQSPAAVQHRIQRRRGCATEAQTLALGTQYRGCSGPWRAIPHGSAHTSFGGSISSIGTAAKDPLFFLLHCNVDRLWAKWQRQNGRFDPALAASYDSSPANPIGHNLPDSMWPWNGITGDPRPPTAPGGALAASPCVSAPGPQPVVRGQLDFQGVVSAASRMGFDYDDVAF